MTDAQELPQDPPQEPPLGNNRITACDIEMLPANARQEAENFVKFLQTAKLPALVIAAVDTVPEVVDGVERYATFQSAIGTQDALIQIISWLTSNIVPALAEVNDGVSGEQAH